ncbi:MAG: LysR family transcriptional regulator [Enterobacter hormaechei]
MFISDETLRVIHLVARHQSITTAAEQLNKVPSAISYTIKKAEESLALNCSFVSGRYIELSPAGSYFIEHSKTILGDLEALKRNTVLIHDGIERELTIAVNNIIPGDLLVAFIRDFERQFTSTTLTVDLEVYNGWDALYSKRADLVTVLLMQYQAVKASLANRSDKWNGFARQPTPPTGSEAASIRKQ